MIFCDELVTSITAARTWDIHRHVWLSKASTSIQFKRKNTYFRSSHFVFCCPNNPLPQLPPPSPLQYSRFGG